MKSVTLLNRVYIRARHVHSLETTWCNSRTSSRICMHYMVNMRFHRNSPFLRITWSRKIFTKYHPREWTNFGATSELATAERKRRNQHRQCVSFAKLSIRRINVTENMSVLHVRTGYPRA